MATDLTPADDGDPPVRSSVRVAALRAETALLERERRDLREAVDELEAERARLSEELADCRDRRERSRQRVVQRYEGVLRRERRGYERRLDVLERRLDGGSRVRALVRRVSRWLRGRP